MVTEDDVTEVCVVSVVVTLVLVPVSVVSVVTVVCSGGPGWRRGPSGRKGASPGPLAS